MKTASNSISINALLDRFRPGMRIFVQAGPSESIAFRAALTARPDCARGVTFTGIFIPGVNSFDFASLDPQAEARSSFVPPSSRASFAAGRMQLVPLHYSELGPFLRAQKFDLAILHCPPDRGGAFSLGLNADVALAGVAASSETAVLINPQMPRTTCRTNLLASQVHWRVDADSEILSVPSDPSDATSLVIARHVVNFIGDGDVLQTGIGRIPGAVLNLLHERRGLKLYGGMLSDEVVGLAAAGALGKDTIITGMAIGSRPLWDFSRDENVTFCATDETHDIRRLAALDDFVAINSAVEIDLFGQVNGERVGGKQISGIGGSNDFSRGARAAKNGRSIIALPATARGVSRIVPLISGPISQSRNDADIFVTEHGAARVRYMTLDERAKALIAIADPTHRSMLTDAWRELRATL